VTGVEPNDAMREAGDDILGRYSNFASVKGTAETTMLPDHSIDLITAGQAFHWFDPPRARTEFLRILKPDGWVALIWNRRAEGESAFLDDYHEMMQRYSTEFDQVVVRDQTADDGMSILFGADNYSKFTLPHDQALDAEAFWGRLISSSYTPLPGEPGHDEIRARSTEIFDQYSSDGVLRYPYETQIFLGRPGGTSS
jgi:SAM-dependent methyltransferase